jgi:hypothetical protein
VARAVRERRRRPQDGIGARPQRRQAPGQLARPALDAAELRAGGGARVDGDRAGQGAGTLPRSRVADDGRADAAWR